MYIAKEQFIFTDTPNIERKARIALIGPTGGGKTYTGLQMLGQLIEPGQLVAVLDTEHESAYVYKKVIGVPFQWVNLTSHHPEMYIAAIEAAEDKGIFGGVLVDSLSHAWTGKDGALDLVDQVTLRSKSHNSFTSWREVTPFHNALVNKLLACRLHLLVTMRSKMEYVIEEYFKNGEKKTNVRKVGLQPVQRDGLEYEFDVIGDLDPESNRLIISKTRCSVLSGKQFVKDGVTPGKMIRSWLRELAETSPAAAAVAPEPAMPVRTAPTREVPATASDPASVALCTHFIGLVKNATADDIVAIKDEAKKALVSDKALLAQFHAEYARRYAVVFPRNGAATS